MRVSFENLTAEDAEDATAMMQTLANRLHGRSEAAEDKATDAAASAVVAAYADKAVSAPRKQGRPRKQDAAPIQATEQTAALADAPQVDVAASLGEALPSGVPADAVTIKETVVEAAEAVEEAVVEAVAEAVTSVEDDLLAQLAGDTTPSDGYDAMTLDELKATFMPRIKPNPMRMRDLILERGCKSMDALKAEDYIAILRATDAK